MQIRNSYILFKMLKIGDHMWTGHRWQDNIKKNIDEGGC
jgi:hypothetical protein